jgi:hypothetical protein
MPVSGFGMTRDMVYEQALKSHFLVRHSETTAQWKHIFTTVFIWAIFLLLLVSLVLPK